MTDDERAEILRLHALNWTVRAIAKHLGVSRMAVQRVIAAHAADVESTPAAETAAAFGIAADEPDLIRTLVVAGGTYEAVADELNIPLSRVQEVMADDNAFPAAVPPSPTGLTVDEETLKRVREGLPAWGGVDDLSPDGGPSGVNAHTGERTWEADDYEAGRCRFDDLSVLEKHRTRYTERAFREGQEQSARRRRELGL